jgi:SAM-dependent methyltransferase
MMRRYRGWTVRGVELSARAAAVAQAKGLVVDVGDFVSVELPEMVFDVITAWDVLEHVYEPIAFLRKAWSLLRPGGMLVLRTPNASSLNRRLFGVYWAGWDLPRHLTVFTPSRLGQMLCEVGFVESRAMYPLGTYADFVISGRFWLQDHIQSNRRQQLTIAFLESLPARILLLPYTRCVEWLRLGAHMTMIALKPSVLE